MIPIKYGVVLTFFLFIGFLLRIYNINNNPPELFADEIANSLSALSILKTGKDVNSRLLPYFFYEVELISPIYGYISAPFVLIFGKSALAVRLPAVLLGTASIFFIYKLIYLITNDLNVSICSALILSLLPWHIHYSRIGWQPALEVPLMIISIHFFLKYVKLFKNKYLFLSILFFVTFFYSSRASEFFSPALLFLLVVININKFKINKKNLILLILFYFILLTPFFYTLITQTHLYVRAKRIFTFNNGITYNSLSVFFRNYFSHFSSSFLFIKGDSNLRYSPGSHGLLYWWLLPFVIIGIFISILKFKDNNYKFLTICLFFYPLGGSLTNDECPRATRSMIGVIIFCFFASLGIVSLFKLLNKFYKREFFYLFFLILINAIVVEFLFFCHDLIHSIHRLNDNLRFYIVNHF